MTRKSFAFDENNDSRTLCARLCAQFADNDRRDQRVRRAVKAAMPRIYNRLAREATTEYVWIVEDDIRPPLHGAQKLLRCMDEDVASVSGTYRSRYQPGWVAWYRQGKALEASGVGLMLIGGNGFGCVILRKSVLQQTVLQHANPTGDYDPNFYRWLAGTRCKARLDWLIECEHPDVHPEIAGVTERASDPN